MKLPDFHKTLETVKIFEQRNRETILSGLAVGGLWTSIYLAYKSGPKAEKILQEKKQDLRDTRPEDKETKRIVVWEAVKELTPVVAPTMIFGGMTTACILGSNAVSKRKIATLSAAYTLTDQALRDYKSKVRDILGESKAQQVREAISKEHLDKVDIPKEEDNIAVTGLGNTLCYDEYTDRLFYCSAEAIGKAIVKLSYDLQSDMWIDLNDFYQEINLRPCKMGNELGWSIDHSDRGKIPVYYTAILTDDNRPCLCVQFDVEVKPSLY